MSSSPSVDPLGRLIGMAYDAALMPELWHGVAQQMAKAFGGCSAILRFGSVQTGLAVISATDNMVLGQGHAELAKYWRANDWFSQAAVRNGVGHIANTRDLIEDARLRQSAYYNDWLRVLGIDKAVGGVLEVPEWGQVVIGVHRAPGTPHFEEKDVAWVSQWVRHLTQALYLQHRLGLLAGHQSLQDHLLAACGEAIFVIDEQLRILQATPAAERALRSARFLSSMQGRLHLRTVGVQQTLACAVKGLVGNDPGAACRLYLDDGNGARAMAAVSPLQASERSPAGGLALVHFCEADQRSIEPEQLKHLFALTSAEARVVARLAEGACVDSIALELKVQRNTVQAHLKKALSKTGTRRQVELVALVCRACLAS